MIKVNKVKSCRNNIIYIHSSILSHAFAKKWEVALFALLYITAKCFSYSNIALRNSSSPVTYAYEFTFGIAVLRSPLTLCESSHALLQETPGTFLSRKARKGGARGREEKKKRCSRQGCRSARARHTCILDWRGGRGVNTGALRDTPGDHLSPIT